MFERYTEKARRVIFFARYEASQFGDHEIRDAHLLLGMLRESYDVVWKVLPRTGEAVQHTAEQIRHKVEETLGAPRKAVSTSVDMPLSDASKRILAHAAEEAERLNHRHIGSEHLLLGMLREQGCVAATVLKNVGIELAKAREVIGAAEITAVEPHFTGGGVGYGRAGASAGIRMGGPRAGILEFICDGTLVASVVALVITPVPRVGERVVFKNKEGGEESYRVEDLRYLYERYPPDMAVAPHQLAKVTIQLSRE